MRKSRILALIVLLTLLGVAGIVSYLRLTWPTSDAGNPDDGNGTPPPDDGPPAPEDGSDYLSVSKRLYCCTDAEDATFSKNPPYFMGEQYYFWIEIAVSAKADVREVVVSDSLAAEVQVEGVSFVPIERPGPYDYTFDYSAGYEPGVAVSVDNGTQVWPGVLDEGGVSFDQFDFGWSGASLAARFEWHVGSMMEGEVKTLYVTVSTDVNPDGAQEFATDGVHTLNSEITAVCVVESTGKLVAVASDGIEIMVYERAPDK